MPRFLITDPFPVKPTEVPPDFRVITPGRSASDALERQAWDLTALAKDILRRNGLGVATPMRSAEALRQAAFDVFGRDGAIAARRSREILGVVLRSGLSLDDFERAASPRARPIARLARRYFEILKRSSLVDSDALLAEAARSPSITTEKVLIYGYFRGRGPRARPEEFEFIDRIAADGSRFYLPCGDGPLFEANREWAKVLEDRGWTPVRECHAVETNAGSVKAAAARFAGIDGAAVDEANIVARSYANIDTEVRATLSLAKAAALSGVPPDRIAVVSRDMALYAPLIISTAREYSLPVEIEHKITLGETAFGEFLLLLLETVDLRGAETTTAATTKNHHRGFLFEPTLRLLRHRFGPGLSEEKLREALRNRPSDRAAWENIIGDVASLMSEGERDHSGWCAWLRGIVGRWDVRGTLAADAAELHAHNAFFEALEELVRERGAAPITIAEFAGDLIDILADLKTALHVEIGGVRVLQPNAVVGGEFDHVFIVGLAEGILPTPAADNNVLDFHERKILARCGVHFEDALEVPRWEALSFYFSILACKGRLFLSYPRFANGAELIESAYFERMSIKPSESSERSVSSPQEFRRHFLCTDADGDVVLQRARRQYIIESSRESSSAPDEFDGVTRIPSRRSRWSASSLTRLGSCPFKWFSADVLGLKLPDETDADLRPDLRGRLYHRTLELAVKRARGSADLTAAILLVLEEEFANAEQEHESLPFVSNWEVRRSEHLEKLRFAISGKAFLDDGAEVLATEAGFDAEIAGLRITGKLDRVDRLADGSLLAVDYKSGKYIARIKDDSGYLKIDLQLPIYSQIGLRALYPGKTVAGGVFLSISDASRTPGKNIDLESALTKLRAIVDQGEFAVDPDIRGIACEYCDFDIACRRGPRLLKKRERG